MAATAMSERGLERSRDERYRDRRVDERFQLNAPGGCLNYRGAKYPCLIVDVSLSGCCVRTERTFLPGNLANVEIVLPILGMILHMVGTTQWVTRENLIGIRFLHPSARSKNQLAGLLTGLVDAGATAEVQAAVAAAAQSETSGLAVELPKALLEDLKRKQTPIENPKPENPLAPPPRPVQPAADGEGRSRKNRALITEEGEWPAAIQVLKDGSLLPGSVFGLSLEECSFRAAAPFIAGTRVRVEVDFQMCGLPFRLAGVTEDVHDQHTIEIRFLDMSYRKREELAELIEELRESLKEKPGVPESENA
jgi:hypothetical protein